MEKIFSYAWKGKRGIDVEADGSEGSAEREHVSLYLDRKYSNY